MSTSIKPDQIKYLSIFKNSNIFSIRIPWKKIYSKCCLAQGTQGRYIQEQFIEWQHFFKTGNLIIHMYLLWTALGFFGSWHIDWHNHYQGFVKGEKFYFRYLDFYFRHGEITSTASQLTSPASQKSKDLNKVPLLLPWMKAWFWWQKLFAGLWTR